MCGWVSEGALGKVAQNVKDCPSRAVHASGFARHQELLRIAKLHTEADLAKTRPPLWLCTSCE